ncbi:hypothetical protein ACK8HJ_19025 [Vreelandella titanicae]|uniref:hypothetical protein n=1 Tax=Vreelandella titanicae TaxID=664683 RepID=UPI00191C0C9E|nr:hypothetical protein [Halomonas titanicae]
MNQNNFLSIAYIVMIDKKDDSFTYFNNYPSSLLKKIDIFRKIAELPKDLCEFFCKKEVLIQHRMTGFFDGYRVVFCGDLSEVEEVEAAIKVVFLDGRVFQDIDFPEAIYVSGSLGGIDDIDCVCLKDLEKGVLLSYLNKLSPRFNLEEMNIVSELKASYFNDNSNEYIETDCDLNRSISTEANILVLKSAKLNASYEVFRYECNDEDVFQTINLINYIRNNIAENFKLNLALPAIQIVLSDFSANLDFQINKNEYSQNSLQNTGVEDPRSLEKAIKLILRNGFYEGTEKTKYFNEAYSERLLVETLIGLYSCSSLIPSAKINISNSDLYGFLKDIGINDRSDNQKSLKNKFKKFRDFINKKTSGSFEYLNESRPSEVKIVSNLPIEWSSHNGLPIMLAHNVSRLPVSPGWITTKLLIDSRNIFIDMEGFSDVLVISSFKDEDLIKDHLFSKLESFNNGKLAALGSQSVFDVRAKLTRPSTYRELVSVLNDSCSPMVVFDLHGGHQESGEGLIHLKNEAVSVYDLVQDAKIPPIVVLSSCDTSPIDRNHFSVANGFLSGGAKTVLASALPILSKEASTFIVRLMIRLKEFLPIVINKEKKSLRWSSFMSGMIRRTFYTELIDFLIEKGVIESDKKYNLIPRCGMMIDPVSENFHSEIVSLISNETNISPEEVQRIIDEELVLPECLKYLQLGNPERVVIRSPHEIKRSL